MRRFGLTIETRDLVARLPVCLRVRVWRLVLIWLYWLYLERTSVSIDEASYTGISFVTAHGRFAQLPRGSHTLCSRSIISARGLSARYLTLFHEKLRRYWSSGSVNKFSRSAYKTLILSETSNQNLRRCDVLSLTDLCCAIFCSSPSRMPFKQSPTLATTP